MVGSRGKARHAFMLGGIVTVTHTIGVFTLGLITLALSEFVVPEDLYPWLNLVSALLVVAVGITVLRVRILDWLRPRRKRAQAEPTGHWHEGHDHDGHDHEGSVDLEGYEAELSSVLAAVEERFGEEEPSAEELRAFLHERLVAEGRSAEDADRLLEDLDVGGPG